MAGQLQLTPENVAFVVHGCFARKFPMQKAFVFMAHKFGLTPDDLGDYLSDNELAIEREIAVLLTPHVARRQRHKARMAVDTNYRVANNIRARFKMALKAQGIRKAGKTMDLFGYTAADVVAHLTPMLRPGMTWANYGQVWHIDHIKPVAAFDFTVDHASAVRECWALSNLQPLFVLENIQKGATWHANQK